MNFIRTMFSATYVSAHMTMKGAAKCNKLCEMEASVNNSVFECTRCVWDILASKFASAFINTLFIDMLHRVRIVLSKASLSFMCFCNRVK